MKSIKSVSGKLKAALFMRGWRQGPERYWRHPHDTYQMLRLNPARSGFIYLEIDGLTLRAAAKRERLLPR